LGVNLHLPHKGSPSNLTIVVALSFHDESDNGRGKVVSYVDDHGNSVEETALAGRRHRSNIDDLRAKVGQRVWMFVSRDVLQVLCRLESNSY
jgi:hypothetical protein